MTVSVSNISLSELSILIPIPTFCLIYQKSGENNAIRNSSELPYVGSFSWAAAIPLGRSLRLKLTRLLQATPALRNTARWLSSRQPTPQTAQAQGGGLDSPPWLWALIPGGAPHGGHVQRESHCAPVGLGPVRHSQPLPIWQMQSPTRRHFITNRAAFSGVPRETARKLNKGQILTHRKGFCPP